MDAVLGAALDIPKLPWSPEEIREKLEKNWPNDLPDEPDLPATARLHVSALKKWRHTHLEGSEGALLDTFGRFEKAVNLFSEDLERAQNHQDPAKRLPPEQVQILKKQYDEAFAIVRGEGGYLRIYREWNKRYAASLKQWQDRL